MRIKIAQRYAPFSTSYGVKVPILRTDWTVKVYPTLWVFSSKNQSFEVKLPLSGPFANHLCLLNAEKGFIEISGKALEGYFRLQIIGGKKLEIRVKKMPKFLKPIYDQSALDQVIVKPLVQIKERLALGNNKKQDIDAIRSRQDLAEILPIWHKISGFYPEKPFSALLDLQIMSSTFFREFSGIFCPDSDPYHLNIAKAISQPFSYGPSLIRSLFLESEGSCLHFLPKMLFPFGKMTDISVEGIGVISFEWSKKKLRRLEIQSAHTKEICLKSRDLKKARLKKSKESKNILLNHPICLEANHLYLFDRFEK